MTPGTLALLVYICLSMSRGSPGSTTSNGAGGTPTAFPCRLGRILQTNLTRSADHQIRMILLRAQTGKQ